ncbi:MAG TPA: TasA family protein [Actinomycetota bacterium]|nr:TasA family protein [Actinomycetota bacterium]
MSPENFEASHRPALRGDKGRLATAILVVTLSLVAVTVTVTGAVFTDTGSVGSNTLTTGSVDISTSPASALVTASAMAPGDKSEASLTVSNSGSLQMRYAIQRSATNTDSKALREALRLRIALRGSSTCDFPYYSSSGTASTLTDDTQLYEGLGFPATPLNTVGDATTGEQTGDRTLAGAANEALCVSVVLPSSAGNSVQNATTTATFDFVAEQTANN